MPAETPGTASFPGFGLTLGYTVSYLSLIVLIPLAALVLRGADQPWADFRAAVFDPRTLLRLAADLRNRVHCRRLINAFFGFIVAWVLVRYDFPGRRMLDALIDLPFALPTAVSGIALTAIYAPERLDRPLAAAARDQGRVLAARHRDRADVHRAAVHRAHRAADHRGSGSRDGRSGGAARAPRASPLSAGSFCPRSGPRWSPDS